MASTKAQRDRAADRAALSAPFIAIDSEGGSVATPYDRDGKVYQPHKSFLWGAGDSNGDVEWLFHWRPLTTIEILDWLKHIRETNPKSIFISFAFGYDVGQIVADLPYDKAWELQNGKPYAEKDNVKCKSSSRRVVYWRDYGLQYLKGKQFSVTFGDNQRQSKQRIRIYDVFGFFQSSFLQAIRSTPGVASASEYAIIEKGKSERGTFEIGDIANIKEYTRHELMVLCRMMDKLRQSLAGQNLILKTWFGAGSIASSLLKRENVRQHLGDVWGDDISDDQRAAHHAFFGGRIELIKQGSTSDKLYGYDIASAYPAALSQLSSMKSGSWERIRNPSSNDIQSSDALSILHVRAKFRQNLSFYPLPYRTPSGSILFPKAVNGFYMLEEAKTALELFSDNLMDLATPELLRFRPANDGRPFAFLRDMFDYRLSLSKDDITQIVVKLGINSCYGKLAQAVGQFGRPPVYASPWHAAAITAWTRARLFEAAMLDPDAVVMLATDGIVSMRRLPLEIPPMKTLGAWEASELPQGGVFVQSGVYCFADEKGVWKAKSRGFRPSNVRGSIADFLRETIPAQWASSAESFEFPYQNYMTLGASVVNRETWETIGQWVTATRDLNLAGAGIKRDVTKSAMQRRERSRRLIPTLPNNGNLGIVDHNGDMLLSAPSKPEWLDVDFGFEQSLENEQEQIMAGFG